MLYSVASIGPLHTIIFEKIGQHFRFCQVVDGDNLKFRIAKYFTKRQSANSSKSINCNFNTHKFLLLSTIPTVLLFYFTKG